MVPDKPSSAVQIKEQQGVWRKTSTPNLVCYVPAGTYYIRARIRGQILRESLKTTNYQVARVKVSERLRELRMHAGGSVDCAPETLQEAIAMVRGAVANDPALKRATRVSYLEELDAMRPGSPGALPTTPLLRLTAQDMAQWWERVAGVYAPQRANHLLMFVRRAIKAARKAGGILRDPSEELKRLKIPRTRLELPSLEQFRELVASIRSQRIAANRSEAANWVEFMAYSGMRPGEIQALSWEHIDEKSGTIGVHGGEEGTKNRESRHVPIIPAMAELLVRMRNGKSQMAGPVFTLKKPHEALRNACERVGIPHQRIYNLRHLFATICRDSGVPVPTFAEWLGHRDGGALAMRTYIQKSTEHSRAAAAKVSF